MNIWKERNWGPMLLKEVDKPFNSNEYIYELKYDGIRSLCFVDSKKINFISRNQNDITNKYLELKNIKENITGKVIFDGEIVLLDKRGYPNFASLLARHRLTNQTKLNLLSQENPVVYIVFDILYENKDLTNLPLMERKKILEKYQDTDNFIKAKYIDKDGKSFFKEIKRLNLEGMVAKHKDSTYHIDKRTDDFIKIKNIKRDEFIIGGYEVKKKNLIVYLGEEKGDFLTLVGKCSLSLNNPDATKILGLKTDKNSFQDLDDDIIYTKLDFRCYIDYTEKTKNNHLRHPIFKGLV